MVSAAAAPATAHRTAMRAVRYAYERDISRKCIYSPVCSVRDSTPLLLAVAKVGRFEDMEGVGSRAGKGARDLRMPVDLAAAGGQRRLARS